MRSAAGITGVAELESALPARSAAGDPLFLRWSIWRQAAENVGGSLLKGSRVVGTRRQKQRSYETEEGEKRTVVELDVDEVGPSPK